MNLNSVCLELKVWNGKCCMFKWLSPFRLFPSVLYSYEFTQLHHFHRPSKVTFLMNEETSLADLLALNLHEFEDDVRNIVDKATKELGMEKVLNELNVTWSTMEFEYEPHLGTKTPMVKANEELIETLEDNQVGCIFHIHSKTL